MCSFFCAYYHLKEMNDYIDGYPREEFTCPSCGQLYGHHNTKVDPVSEECSACIDITQVLHFISAKEFIKQLKERI